MRRRKEYFRQKEEGMQRLYGRRLYSVIKELKDNPYDWRTESKEEIAEMRLSTYTGS